MTQKKTIPRLCQEPEIDEIPAEKHVTPYPLLVYPECSTKKNRRKTDWRVLDSSQKARLSRA